MDLVARAGQVQPLTEVAEAARLAAAFIEDSGCSIRPARIQPTVPESTTSSASAPTAERMMLLSRSNRFVSTLAASPTCETGTAAVCPTGSPIWMLSVT